MGPTDDPSTLSATQSNAKYEEDIFEVDPENDPTWYRATVSNYPCYKLTEGSLYNF